MKKETIMQNVNYIKHLKGVFLQFSKDNRLNPTHISLYIALFQIWNINRFAEVFYVNREEVMKFSKIGSKSTYHRCIKELSHWKYLIYYPSHNPYKGSKIKMLKFETSTGQALVHNRPKNDTSNGQALVSINKHIQTKENIVKLDQPKNEKEVIDFFKKEKWPIIEAQKFYNHYQGIGWKVGGKTKIVNWQATAKNWMIKAEEIKENKTQKSVNQNRDNLKTSKNKNYNEPL
tara:strand:- start:102 stop:797 length:696 start_codon:yes stop_codon:yes gene_type:complete